MLNMDYFVFIKNQQQMKTEIEMHEKKICDYTLKLQHQLGYFEKQILINNIKYHKDMKNICYINLEHMQRPLRPKLISLPSMSSLLYPFRKSKINKSFF